MVVWRLTDSLDENNRLHEGRTVLMYKDGDRTDPTNYRPITRFPTITKIVTIAIHEQTRKWLFGNIVLNIPVFEQNGVGTSQ